jgi:hypothetical protein
MHYILDIKRLIAFCLVCLWTVTPAFSSDSKVLCEVLEVSGTFKTSSGQLNNIHYIVLHHARDIDRQRLSKWLRSQSGKEIRFIIHGKTYRGVLCRLTHCFGRGLLIYTGDIRPKRKDIIEIIPVRQEK